MKLLGLAFLFLTLSSAGHATGAKVCVASLVPDPSYRLETKKILNDFPNVDYHEGISSLSSCGETAETVVLIAHSSFLGESVNLIYFDPRSKVWSRLSAQVFLKLERFHQMKNLILLVCEADQIKEDLSSLHLTYQLQAVPEETDLSNEVKIKGLRSVTQLRSVLQGLPETQLASGQ